MLKFELNGFTQVSYQEKFFRKSHQDSTHTSHSKSNDSENKGLYKNNLNGSASVGIIFIMNQSVYNWLEVIC